MSDKYDFGGLFVAIAAPFFLSGLLGLYIGAVNLSGFFGLLFALYLLLCASNAMESSYNKQRGTSQNKKR